MQTILITGADGQLGKKIHNFAKEYPEFNFIFSDLKDLDITNASEAASFFDVHKPDIVINCAAYTAVDKAESDEATAKAVNATGSKVLAENCEKHNSKLYHISTDYVFGSSAQNTPFSENDTPSPNSVYGRTKLEGEQFLQGCKNVRIFRTAWLYSEYGHNFLKTMLRLGRERDEINVVFDQVSTPTYAGDLAKALLDIAGQDNEKDFDCDILHYSNEGVCSWYDFAREIFEQKKINCRVNPIRTKQYPTPAKRPPYSVLDKEKIKRQFGISIPYYKESLYLCLEQIKD